MLLFGAYTSPLTTPGDHAQVRGLGLTRAGARSRKHVPDHSTPGPIDGSNVVLVELYGRDAREVAP